MHPCFHPWFWCQAQVGKLYSFLYQKRGFKPWYSCPDTGRQFFRLPYTKHLASSQGFDVRLQVNVVVRDCYTDVQSFMHQRPGFNPGFWCQGNVRDLQRFSWIKDLASTQGFDVKVMSEIFRVVHASKTWLPSMVSMSGSWQKMYWFLYTKDVVLSKGFYVRKLSDSCFGFHTPNAWLQARVLMSGYCQTVIQTIMHQKPGFKLWLWCPNSVRQL